MAMKLQSNAVWVLVILAVVGMLLYFTQYYKPATVVAPVEYKGEFDTLYAPEDPGILDDFSDISIADKGVYQLNTSVNLLNGNYYLMAFGVKVKGDMKELTVDAKILNTNDFKLEKVFIVPDEKGITYTEDKAIAVASIEDKGQSAKLKLAPLSDGKYIVVVKVFSKTDTTGENEIAQLDFDASTEGDVDQFTVKLARV